MPVTSYFVLPAAVFAFLAMFTLFGTSPGRTATVCPGSTDPVQLTVEPFFGKIRYRMGNTRGDLKRIRHAGLGPGLPGNWYPLGLTEARFEIRLNTDVTIQPLAPRRHCAFPHALEVLIGYPEFTVWIDRRYRRGTCEYQAILDHEHNHIRIYRDQLRQHIDSLHLEIARVLRTLRPVTGWTRTTG